MSFNNVAKISFVAALAIGSNAAENVTLTGVEVTGTGGGANTIDEVKITTRNATLLKDVMRDIPGVYVGGTNGMNQKIYMRGVSDRGLNITIDGAKQNGNTFHHNADLLIDPDLIKAVEVEVGAKSVVNGSGALGGSVAFKTVDAKDLLEDGEVVGAKIRTGYASNNEEFSQGLMLFATPVDGLDFLAALNHKGYDYGKSGNDKQMGGDGNDLSYLFKIGYSFLDYHRVSLSTEHTQYKGMYPARAEFGSWHTINNAPQNRKYERDTNTINYSFNPSDLLKLEISAYYTKHQRIGSPDSRPRFSSDTTLGVKTIGGNVKATTKVDTGDFYHALRYGLEYYQSKNYNKNTGANEKIYDYSAYIENALKYGDLTVTPGIRFTKHTLKSFNGRPSDGNEYSKSFNAVTPALAIDYNIGYGITAFANYAKLFRGPDVMESLFMSRGNTYRNYDNLKKTTGNAYEIGGKYKTEFNQNSSLSFIAKYFKTEYKNLIVDNESISNVYTRMNAGDATIDGVELFTRLNIENLSLGAGYTHQNVKYKNRVGKPGGGYYTSNIIGYRDQGDKYTFNAEYSINSLDTLIGYNLIYFASTDTISAGDDKSINLPSYAVSDIYLTYAPSSGKFKGLEVNAGIYNLFDKAYVSQSQRRFDDEKTYDWEPGRNLKLNVSYKF